MGANQCGTAALEPIDDNLRWTAGKAKRPKFTGGFMQRFAALVATGLFVVSCSPEGEVTESTNKSATTLHSSYNPKVHDQCVDVWKSEPKRAAQRRSLDARIRERDF
jgi:hypothetical protein